MKWLVVAVVSALCLLFNGCKAPPLQASSFALTQKDLPIGFLLYRQSAALTDFPRVCEGPLEYYFPTVEQVWVSTNAPASRKFPTRIVCDYGVLPSYQDASSAFRTCRVIGNGAVPRADSPLGDATLGEFPLSLGIQGNVVILVSVQSEDLFNGKELASGLLQTFNRKLNTLKVPHCRPAAIKERIIETHVNLAKSGRAIIDFFSSEPYARYDVSISNIPDQTQPFSTPVFYATLNARDQTYHFTWQGQDFFGRTVHKGTYNLVVNAYDSLLATHTLPAVLLTVE